MLERLVVVTGAGVSERGRLSGRLAVEFPSVHIDFRDLDAADADPAVLASEWERDEFDTFAFDRSFDRQSEGFQLTIMDDLGNYPSFALEVLNRCQRLVGRRNISSEGALFNRVLAVHHRMHDLSRPLVRSDYDHSIDAWQWVIRLEPRASLALQFAALFHGVERLRTDTDRRVQHFAPDHRQQFTGSYAHTGADIAHRVLREAGVPHDVAATAASLIQSHRLEGEGDGGILADADGLSFLSLNSTGYSDRFGPERTWKKIARTWQRMRPGARQKLDGVKLRSDIRAMLDQVRREEQARRAFPRAEFRAGSEVSVR